MFSFQMNFKSYNLYSICYRGLAVKPLAYRTLERIHNRITYVYFIINKDKDGIENILICVIKTESITKHDRKLRFIFRNLEIYLFKKYINLIPVIAGTKKK